MSNSLESDGLKLDAILEQLAVWAYALQKQTSCSVEPSYLRQTMIEQMRSEIPKNSEQKHNIECDVHK